MHLLITSILVGTVCFWDMSGSLERLMVDELGLVYTTVKSSFTL